MYICIKNSVSGPGDAEDHQSSMGQQKRESRSLIFKVSFKHYSGEYELGAIQESLPNGKVMSKLEIDVGLVLSPLATPSALHWVSTRNGPKPRDLSISPCLDLKQSLLLILLCTFTCRENMLLSHRL